MQIASNGRSKPPIHGQYWHLKLAVLIACVICGWLKLRSPASAQTSQAPTSQTDYAAKSNSTNSTNSGSSTSPRLSALAVSNENRNELQSAQPETPIPATPIPRDIANQIVHRTLLESVWGEPMHCSIRQSIQIFGKKRSSFGNYVRGGKGMQRMRLTLQIPAGDQMNSVLQISDGELFTTYESIGNHVMMTQVDLGKIRERIVITKNVLQDPVIAMYLAIGGQAEELRRISQKYDWTKVTEGRLGDQAVWWIRGQATTQPLQKQAKALVDTRLFEQPYDAAIPPNIKLAIGHTDSSFPFWLYQVEKWDDGDPQGRNKSYVLTEWDSPALLLPEQITPDLFRLRADQSLHEIREETKLYLPPPQSNTATQPQPRR